MMLELDETIDQNYSQNYAFTSMYSNSSCQELVDGGQCADSIFFFFLTGVFKNDLFEISDMKTYSEGFIVSSRNFLKYDQVFEHYLSNVNTKFYNLYSQQFSNSYLRAVFAMCAAVGGFLPIARSETEFISLFLLLKGLFIQTLQ